MEVEFFFMRFLPILSFASPTILKKKMNSEYKVNFTTFFFTSFVAPKEGLLIAGIDEQLNSQALLKPVGVVC